MNLRARLAKLEQMLEAGRHKKTIDPAQRPVEVMKYLNALAHKLGFSDWWANLGTLSQHDRIAALILKAKTRKEQQTKE